VCGWHGSCYAADVVPSCKSLSHNDLGGGPRKCLILNYLRGWSELARIVPTSPAPRVLAWLKVANVAHEFLPAAFALGKVVAVLSRRTGILLIRRIEIPDELGLAIRAVLLHVFHAVRIPDYEVIARIIFNYYLARITLHSRFDAKL
jgi:hypothetical protein